MKDGVVLTGKRNFPFGKAFRSSPTWRKALISSDKTCASIPNGKLLTQPSKRNVNTFLGGIRKIIRAVRGMSAADLIRKLNPAIRGWTNHHRHVVSARTFARVDHHIFQSGAMATTRTPEQEHTLAQTEVLCVASWS